MATGSSPPAPLQKKVCMVGAYAVGKTSLVRRFVESIFSDRYLTTVGVKIDKKEVAVGDRRMTMMIWDLAGEDELAQIRKSHLRGAAGYILVADGSRRHTLETAIDLQRRLAADLGPVPFVLALNKADLGEEWEIEAAEAEILARQGWSIISTSAKTADGVEELFAVLARKLLNDWDERRADRI